MFNSLLDLFAAWPSYAERSDQLALAMAGGDEGAFREFVAFHLALAKWGARRWARPRLGFDQEDGEQIAVMGLLRAAQLYDRSRGSQFSTYAFHWIRQMCQRYAPLAPLTIRFPDYWIREFLRLQWRLDRCFVEHGAESVLRLVQNWAEDAPSKYDRWRRQSIASGIQSLSDPLLSRRAVAQALSDRSELPIERLERQDTATEMRRAMERLNPIDSAMLGLRYGFEGDELTLEEIGLIYGLTRERIRQRLDRAEAKLRDAMKNAVVCRSVRQDKLELEEDPLGAAAIAVSRIRYWERALLVELSGAGSGVNAATLRARTGVSESMCRRVLSNLRRAGLIEQVGETRGARYRVPPPSASNPTSTNGTEGHGE